MGKSKAKKLRQTTRGLPDWHLWSEVTRTVSPLPRKKTLSKKSSPQLPIDKILSTAEESQQRHQHALNNRKSTSATITSWSASAVPPHQSPLHRILAAHTLPLIEPKIHRRVRRGQMPIDATIDLHGLHQNEARSALYRFVEARAAYGDRTLLIITGKGLKKTGSGRIEQRGVLRHMLPLWLKEPALAPLIAGFETSARQHGGEGAYYVRLKRGFA